VLMLLRELSILPHGSLVDISPQPLVLPASSGSSCALVSGYSYACCGGQCIRM
jgi:hypothetical protein